jgi:hypothetical protein
MTEHRGIFTLDDVEPYLAEEADLEVTELGPRLWSATDGTYRTIFMDAGDGVVAWDTFQTPGRARSYAQAIARTIPGKPIKWVVYSNDHLDRSGFAADLAPTAARLADRRCAEVITLRGADGQLPATCIVEDDWERVDVGAATFEFIFPGFTSATGNRASYFADLRVLYMPDTALPNAKYSMLPNYHVRPYSAAMRQLLVLEVDTFVPGRWGIMTREQLVDALDYFDAVHDVAQQAFAENVAVWMFEPTEAFVKEKLRTRFGHLEGFEDHVGITAFRFTHHYLTGGWGMEDTATPSAGHG